MVALVTGGGRGIGRGMALRLAKEGWQVAVTARSADQLAETVRLAEGRVISIAADVADPAAVKSTVSEANEKLGPVDLLVNNAAASGPLGLFWETDPEDWWGCQEVNVRGPMLFCREIVPSMVARRAGRIINVVSGAGCQPFPDMSAYVVSKTALIRFSEQMALELRPYGVSVFPMRPGLVRTAMVEASVQRLPFIQKWLDEGLDVTPGVVAQLVLSLASGRADALSGRLFSVDEDFDGIVGRTEQILRDDLQALRVNPVPRIA
jgi:NAD(P)-dependent dehydrogenase (short-subunit alcohol dehydrogenase family)